MSSLDLLYNGTLDSSFTNSTTGFVLHHALDILKRQYEDYFLLALNLGALIIFVLDKCRAISDGWRVREILLYFCCLNAPIASISGMLISCHKIRKIAFYLLVFVGLVLMWQSYGFLADSDVYWWKVLGLINIGIALVEVFTTIGDGGDHYWAEIGIYQDSF